MKKISQNFKKLYFKNKSFYLICIYLAFVMNGLFDLFY